MSKEAQARKTWALSRHLKSECPFHRDTIKAIGITDGVSHIQPDGSPMMTGEAIRMVIEDIMSRKQKPAPRLRLVSSGTDEIKPKRPCDEHDDAE